MATANSLRGVTVKLRNSCNNCATAKIKCSREKPICARCAKRLETCVYGTSKRVVHSMRVARKNARSQAITPAVTSWDSPSTTSVDTNDVYCFDGVSAPSSMPSQDWEHLFDGILTTDIDPSLASATFGGAGEVPPPETFESAMSSLFEFSVPTQQSGAATSNQENSIEESLSSSTDSSISFGLARNNMLPQSTDVNIGIDKAGASNGEKVPGASSTPPSSCAETLNYAQNKSTEGEDTNTESYRAVDCHFSTQCQCYILTLGSLGSLSADPSPSNIFQRSNIAKKTSTLEFILKQTSEARFSMSTVLDCTCSIKDGDVSMLVCLVIAKVLVWYTTAVDLASSDDTLIPLSGSREAVAGKQIEDGMSQDDEGLESSSKGFDGEDPSRLFFQSILSRLVGVQALVSRLLLRFDGPESLRSCFRGAEASEDLSLTVGRSLASKTDLQSVSLSLRRRLLGLSSAVTELLRQGQ